MTRLVRAELLKLRTTQVWFWLMLLTIAIGTLVVVATLATNSVHNGHDVHEMFSSAETSSVAPFVLGLLGVTTEFRYQTITSTVLGTPSRWRLISAKVIAYGITALGYALACIGVELAIALPWLNAKGIDYSWAGDHLSRVLSGVLVVDVLYAIMGLGFGALMRNQAVALPVGIIFITVIQTILLAIPKVRYAFAYMPGGLVTSIVQGDKHSGDVTLLGPATAVALLLAWAVVPAFVGARTTLDRDIT